MHNDAALAADGQALHEGYRIRAMHAKGDQLVLFKRDIFIQNNFHSALQLVSYK